MGYWCNKSKKCKLCKKLKKLLLELSTVSTSLSLRHVYKFAWADGYEYVEGIDGDEILFKDQLNKDVSIYCFVSIRPKTIKGIYNIR